MSSEQPTIVRLDQIHLRIVQGHFDLVDLVDQGRVCGSERPDRGAQNRCCGNLADIFAGRILRSGGKELCVPPSGLTGRRGIKFG
ncbi:hypothetical protein CHN51_08820 [Sphingorhabdus sp. YGSMI21]|nr:hypothetical protein CHN51_08820 [Sphingorhabdus sp. YGSMI21]